VIANPLHALPEARGPNTPTRAGSYQRTAVRARWLQPQTARVDRGSSADSPKGRRIKGIRRQSTTRGWGSIGTPIHQKEGYKSPRTPSIRCSVWGRVPAQPRQETQVRPRPSDYLAGRGPASAGPTSTESDGAGKDGAGARRKGKQKRRKSSHKKKKKQHKPPNHTKKKKKQNSPPPHRYPPPPPPPPPTPPPPHPPPPPWRVTVGGRREVSSTGTSPVH